MRIWNPKEKESGVKFNAVVNQGFKPGGGQADVIPLLTKLKHSHLNKNIIATAGKEADLRIWDVNDPSIPTFTAKNVS